MPKLPAAFTLAAPVHYSLINFYGMGLYFPLPHLITQSFTAPKTSNVHMCPEETLAAHDVAAAPLDLSKYASVEGGGGII